MADLAVQKLLSSTAKCLCMISECIDDNNVSKHANPIRHCLESGAIGTFIINVATMVASSDPGAFGSILIFLLDTL